MLTIRYKSLRLWAPCTVCSSTACVQKYNMKICKKCKYMRMLANETSQTGNRGPTRYGLTLPVRVSSG